MGEERTCWDIAHVINDILIDHEDQRLEKKFVCVKVFLSVEVLLFC